MCQVVARRLSGLIANIGVPDRSNPGLQYFAAASGLPPRGVFYGPVFSLDQRLVRLDGDNARRGMRGTDVDQHIASSI